MRIYRSEIRRLAGNRWDDSSYLLGGWSGERKAGASAKWRPNAEIVTATFNFAIATEHLEDKRENRVPHEEPETEAENQSESECSDR